MNHLRKVGLASFFFLGLGLLCGAMAPSTIGWTPKTATMISVICYCLGLILALVAFLQSQVGHPHNTTTLFLARGPFALVAIIVLFFFLRAMTGWW
jgi:hypothetical protein